MGPADRRPPLPRFAWTQAPATHRHVSKVIQESNWLQGLEGGIDTSHAPILHRVLNPDATRPGFKPTDPFVRGKAPAIEVDVTDYGYRYAGLRPIIQARRLLLQAIRAAEAGGTPPGVEPTYYDLRPAEAVIPRDTDWRDLLAPDLPRPAVLQQV